MINTVTAIILAGGKSSRFGKDKSFVLFNGKPLIEISIDKLSKLFKDLIIITNNPSLYEKYNIRTETDLVKDCGPLGGIYAGLSASNTKYNFFVACDMPFINLKLIQYMLEEIDDFDVVIPKYNDKLEPLFAIYSKNCIIPIKNQLDNKNLKITDFFESVKTKIISEEEILKFDLDNLSFININTLNDYQRLKN